MDLETASLLELSYDREVCNGSLADEIRMIMLGLLSPQQWTSRGHGGGSAKGQQRKSAVHTWPLFERHGKLFDCGPGVRTEATPPHKCLCRLLDQHTDSVCKPLHAGVPRHPEEWRKTLSI